MHFYYEGDPEPYIDGGTLEYKSKHAFRNYQISFPAAKKYVDYKYYDNQKVYFHITRNLNLDCHVYMELKYIDKEKTRVNLNFNYHLVISHSIPQFPGVYNYPLEKYDSKLEFHTNEKAVGVTSGNINVIYWPTGKLENYFIKLLTE